MNPTWVLAEPHESLVHAECLEHALKAGGMTDWLELYRELPDGTVEELCTKTAVALLALRQAM